MFRRCKFGCNFGRNFGQQQYQSESYRTSVRAPGVDGHLDNGNGINKILAYCEYGYRSLLMTTKVHPIRVKPNAGKHTEGRLAKRLRCWNCPCASYRRVSHERVSHEHASYR